MSKSYLTQSFRSEFEEIRKRIEGKVFRVLVADEIGGKGDPIAYGVSPYHDLKVVIGRYPIEQRPLPGNYVRILVDNVTISGRRSDPSVVAFAGIYSEDSGIS